MLSVGYPSPEPRGWGSSCPVWWGRATPGGCQAHGQGGRHPAQSGDQPGRRAASACPWAGSPGQWEQSIEWINQWEASVTYPGPGEVLGSGPGQGGQVIAGPRQQRRVVSVAQGREPAGHTVPARRGLQ